VTINAPFRILPASIGVALVVAGCGPAFLGQVSQSTPEAKNVAKQTDAKDTDTKSSAQPAKDAKAEAPDEKKADEKKDEKEDKKDEKEEVKGHVEVRCVAARRLPFVVTVDGLGRTEPLPECVGSLTAVVEGHVHELLVKLGDKVKADQPILQLDPTVASATLAEKKANRDSLVAARKLLESLPRPEERRAAELAVEQGKISVEHDQAQVDSLRPLLAHSDVSHKTFHDAEVLLKQAQVQLQTAEAQLKLMMTGPRPEAVAEAQTKIQMADEAVASAKASLEFHTLRAPIAGLVEALNCHPGQTLTIGTPVGEVIDIRRIFVTVYFPARITRLLQRGMVATVDLSDPHAASEPAAKDKEEKKDLESSAKGNEAKDANKDKAKEKAKEKDEKKEEDKDVVSGKVTFIGSSADPQTGNYAVRILMDNAGGRLRLGQVVKANIVLRTEEPQLAVPEAAIFDQGEGPLLAVVRDGKIKLLHPELGATEAGNVAVAKTDLKEGEPVVVEGAYGVADDTEAKILTEPPAAPGAGESKEADVKVKADSKPKEADPKDNEKGKGEEHK
jgi:RND family efflux transporter MFP subunit